MSTTGKILGLAGNSNQIGGVTLSNFDICMSTAGKILGPDTTSNRIGGVTLTNGLVRSAAGTQATPAYTFSNATTSGLYAAGSNDVRLSLSNSERLRLTAESSVGASDVSKTTLSLTGFGVNGGVVPSDQTINEIIFRNGIDAYASAIRQIQQPSAFIDGNRLGFFTMPGAGNEVLVERLSIIRGGNVGIGTTAPAARLDVSGGIQIFGNSTTNTFDRPAIATGSTSTPSYEIRARTFNGDDGFMRLRAGGYTDATVASYIDITGFNNTGDTNQNIVFGTKGQERVKITSNGNIAILRPTGASFPVDVCGIVRCCPQFLVTNSPTSGNWNAIVGMRDGSLAEFASYVRDNTARQDIVFSAINNTNVVERARIVGSNGNVGIGTTTPSNRLTVAGGNIQLGTTSGDYRQFIIGGGNSFGYLYGAFAKYGDGIHLGYNFYNDNTTNVIPQSGGGTSRLSLGYNTIGLYTGGVNTEPTNGLIVSNANVGIGTTTPAHKLDVSGTIRGSSNIVATQLASNWLDVSSVVNDTSLTISYTPKQSTAANVRLIVSANVDAYQDAGTGPDGFVVQIRNNATVLTEFSARLSNELMDGRTFNKYPGGRFASVSVSGNATSLINMRIARRAPLFGDEAVVIQNGYLRVEELSTI